MLFLLTFTLILTISAAAHAYFKGQLHLHTKLSDGNASPDTAARLYRSLGFDFICISDHDLWSDPKEVLTSCPKGLLVIGAQEISFMCRNRMNRLVPFHANAIGTGARVNTPEIRESLSLSAEACVADTLKAGGVCMLNHPNFRFAYSFEEIQHIRQPYLLEIFNLHSGVPNQGSHVYPSHEKIWDTLLTQGRTVYGTATDDAHYYDSHLRFKRNSPAMGWILAEAERCDEAFIMDSLRRGRFLASTGLQPLEYEGTRDRLKLTLDAQDKYTRIEFIGRWGTLLKACDGPEGEYVPRGDELYVRIKAYDETGAVLLTQPVFLDGRNEIIG
ncbi:MAG: PHP domain-containing protein [Abditibacteriota bacterium]|nr:PHP domain-containing protein [Abditibacteriota bacterium]